MLATLALEMFGDDVRAQFRAWSRLLPKEMAEALDPGIKMPWVAQIIGRHPIYTYDRRFLQGRKDYTRSNAVGSRGVYLWFHLEDGQIYEVYERTSWRASRRYFCRIQFGNIVEIDKTEVEACLSARSE